MVKESTTSITTNDESLLSPHPPDADVPVDDVDLLRRIGEHRDKEAFTLLLKTHKSSMYSLATMLIRDPNLAEDALQEAAIRIWRFSHTFRPTGTTRSWILRIVARECLRKTMRKQKKEITMDQEEMQIQREFTHLSDGAEANAQAETNELLEHLRKALVSLEPEDRQLMALAFGTDLTHAEIGYEIAMPRRSVSKRIVAIIDKLRNMFKANGHAAVVPLLTPEFLGRAICRGAASPSGLLAKLTACAVVASRSARLALPTAAKSGGMLKLLGLALTLVLLLVLATAWFYQPATVDIGSSDKTDASATEISPAPTTETNETAIEPPAPPEAVVAPPPAAPATPATPAVTATGFGSTGVNRVEYDFRKNIPADLQFTAKPLWQPPDGALPGRLEIAANERSFSGILFPQQVPPDRPVKISVDFWVVGPAQGFSLMLVREGAIPTQTHWNNTAKMGRSSKNLMPMVYYIYKQYSVCCMANDTGPVVVSVQQYEQPIAGHQMVLATSTLNVSRVILEIVEEQDLPKVIRHIEDRIATYKKMATRENEMIPQLFSSDGQEVAPAKP